MAKDRSLDQLYSIMQSCEVSDSSSGMRVCALLLSHVHLSFVRGHAQRVGHSPLCQDLHGQLTSKHACPCRSCRTSWVEARASRGSTAASQKKAHSASSPAYNITQALGATACWLTSVLGLGGEMVKRETLCDRGRWSDEQQD